MKLEDFRLRRLEEGDLMKVLEWRNSDRIRASMLNDSPIGKEEHRIWFERLQVDPHSVYLVFVRQAVPVGLVYFTDIDRPNHRAQWGFYVGETDQPSGTGSVLGYLGLQNGFEVLEMEKIIGRVLSTNHRSIAFHKKLGFVLEETLTAHVLKNGVHQDLLSFALLKDDWREKRNGISQSIIRGDKSVCTQ